MHFPFPNRESPDPIHHVHPRPSNRNGNSPKTRGKKKQVVKEKALKAAVVQTERTKKEELENEFIEENEEVHKSA